MSVSITSAKVSYSTDSSQTTFPITFDFRDETHIEVILRDVLAETEATLMLGTDYSVSGANVVTVQTYGSGYTLVIRRASPSTQGSDYINNDALDAEVLEDNFDALVLRVQELEEKITRALLMKKSTAYSDLEFPEPENGFFLEWVGGALRNKQHYAGAVTVTAFAATILDDASASAALTTLGVSAFAKTLLDDSGAATVLTTLGISAFAKTILDDSSAAAVRVTIDAAVSSKGVTNGDSHDHAGGDGGQIDHGGLAGLGDLDHKNIGDADGDTAVEMEKNTDEDKARIKTGGTERVVIDSNGIDVKPDGTNSAIKTYSDGNVDMSLKSGVLVTLGANQTVVAAQWTKVALNSEKYDYQGEFSTVNSRFTAERAGLYVITASFLTSGITANYLASGLYIDGAKVNDFPHFLSTATAGVNSMVTFTIIVHLDANQYVELWGYVTETTAFIGDANLYQTHMSINKIA